MTYANIPAALEGNGFCPYSTPVDTLMGAGYHVGLTVAEAMGEPELYDALSADEDIADGFHEAALYEEAVEAVQVATDLAFLEIDHLGGVGTLPLGIYR